jgi:hypothetical protein
MGQVSVCGTGAGDDFPSLAEIRATDVPDGPRKSC